MCVEECMYIIVVVEPMWETKLPVTTAHFSFS